MRAQLKQRNCSANRRRLPRKLNFVGQTRAADPRVASSRVRRGNKRRRRNKRNELLHRRKGFSFFIHRELLPLPSLLNGEVLLYPRGISASLTRCDTCGARTSRALCTPSARAFCRLRMLSARAWDSPSIVVGRSIFVPFAVVPAIHFFFFVVSLALLHHRSNYPADWHRARALRRRSVGPI